MGTKRQPAVRPAMVAAVLAMALSGCTWGRSKPENCARFVVGAGNARLAALAADAGAGEATIEHSLCSNHRERLADFMDVRHEEVGWCARVEEKIPASAVAAGASVGKWCDEAVRRQVRYAHWSSVIGDSLLFVSEYQVNEMALSRPGTGNESH